MRVTFKVRKHDLNVSSFALVILLLFENLGEGDYLTYEEIKDATAIPDNELQRNLQSLACTKFKVLKKHPPGRDVNPEDSFSFNADFSSPLQKIKISTVATRVESGEERKETQDRVEEERRYQTDVCIRASLDLQFGRLTGRIFKGLYNTDYESAQKHDT